MQLSRSVSRVLFFALRRSACHLSTPVVTNRLQRSTLRRGASNPHNVGLHDLTTPKTYSPICHHTAGGLLLHLLTLTSPRKERRLFSSTLLYPRGQLSVRKQDALRCPDFPLLLYNNVPATDRPTAFFMQRYANKRNLCYNCQDSFDSGVSGSCQNGPDELSALSLFHW